MKNNDNFILELYRSRMQHFVTQGNRLWIRFHYFLTAEFALVGLFFLKGLSTNVQLNIIVPILGVICSFLWYLIGAQDLFFYEAFRKGVNSVEENLILPKCGENIAALNTFMKEIKHTPIRFKIKHIGVTSFIAICPIVFLILWVIFFFIF
jgi:hypothetical protein